MYEYDIIFTIFFGGNMDKERAYLHEVEDKLDENIANGTINVISLEKEKEAMIEEVRLDGGDLLRFDSLGEGTNALSERKYKISEMNDNIAFIKKSIKRFERQKVKPYFAKINIDIDSENKDIYIGLGSVINNEKIYVYDWRAPISSMFYDYELGKASYETMEGPVSCDIKLKRQFTIENEELKYYVDTNETINDEILQQVLSQNSSAKMKEVVSTIQREQNALIRGDEFGNILVQGVAGSGKTSVALHRAAYLLYKHKESFKSNDILILSPSNLFSVYISDVLPELGEDNVIESTFYNIAKIELKAKLQTKEQMLEEIFLSKKDSRFGDIAYKASFQYLDDINDFIKNVFSRTFRPQELSFRAKDSGEPIFVFTKEEMNSLYYDTYANLDISKRIDYMTDYLIERLNLKKNEFNPIKQRFKGMLYKFFPVSECKDILKLFLSTKDIEMDETIIAYEDIPSIMYIKKMVYGLDNKFPAKYLIIDEMQDFTPVHFEIFNCLWDCPKLILGDINQCIEKKLTDEYLDKLAKFMDTSLIKLNKTYRSTKEISEFCQKIIGLKDVVNMSRKGNSPEIIKTDNIVESLVKCISTKGRKYKRIAIICKTIKEVNDLYSGLSKVISLSKVTERDSDFDYPIIITTVSASKGIEFDYVIIPNVDCENYKNELDKNILYVASTRALHELDLVYTKRFTELLKK